MGRETWDERRDEKTIGTTVRALNVRSYGHDDDGGGVVVICVYSFTADLWAYSWRKQRWRQVPIN